MEVFIKRLSLIIVLSCQSLSNFAFSQAYFAPGDNLTTIFIDLIDSEEKSIHGAIYMFTDKKIAQALVNAHKRGVDIQIVIDQVSMNSYGKVKFLKENGISVLVHRTDEFNPYTMALMHNKFFIFGCNKNKAPLLWTGSWNCTVRGTSYNDENVILLDDQLIIQQYLDTFFALKYKLIK